MVSNVAVHPAGLGGQNGLWPKLYYRRLTTYLECLYSFRKFPLAPPATRALYILKVDLESMGGLREKVFTHYFAVVLSECGVHAGTDYRGNI
jgi:hypothetical protein